MSETASVMVAVDSLVANEFAVELDGQPIQGVFRISGLVSFRLGGEHPPFKLVKMVQRDANNAFNKWLRETVKAGGSQPRRTLSVIAIDDGVETRRWTAKGAWISEVAYSDFDSGSSEMIGEIVTIHFDQIEETWAATANLE